MSRRGHLVQERRHHQCDAVGVSDLILAETRNPGPDRGVVIVAEGASAARPVATHRQANVFMGAALPRLVQTVRVSPEGRRARLVIDVGDYER